MRRLIFTLFGLALIAIVAIVATAQPARAEQLGWRFYDKQICVQDETPAGSVYEDAAYLAETDVNE